MKSAVVGQGNSGIFESGFRAELFQVGLYFVPLLSVERRNTIM